MMSRAIPDDETGGAIRLMKKHIGARWALVDGRPRTRSHEAA
jgi:hypothetical protein